MKLFGSIKELVAVVFRLASGKEVRVTSVAQTGGSVSPAVAVEIQIPDVGASGSDTLVTAGAVQTLTNKTIDANGTGNSITNLEEADFQTKLADANKVLTRNASGVVTSATITNSNVSATAAIAESKLSLSYSTSSLNSAIDTKIPKFTIEDEGVIVVTDSIAAGTVKQSPVTVNPTTGSITPLGAGPWSLGANVGANNLTVGGATTTVVIPGNLQIDGTSTTVNTSTLDVEDTNITINKGGSDATSEGSGLTVDRVGTDGSLIYKNTSATKWAAGSLGSEVDLVGTSSSQTLTNKTLTSPVMNDYMDINEEASPATPSAGAVRFYAKSDKKLYTKDSNGVEQEIGSGSGQGEKNYIENPSASSSTTGWVSTDSSLDITRITTPSALPREHTTGTGLLITVLDGDTATSNSARIVYNFTLDDVDLNKKLKIEWAQKVPSGGGFQVYVAAATNTLVPLSSVYNIPSSDLVFEVSFDSGSTAALALVITASSVLTNDTLTISDVIVGPGQIIAATPIGPWTSYTPVVFGATNGSTYTNSTATGYWRRVGDTVEVNTEILFTGAPGTGTGPIALSFPTGLTPDTTKLDLTFLNSYGHGMYRDAGTQTYALQATFDTTVPTSSGGLKGFIMGLPTLASGAAFSPTAPATIANSDYATINIKVPIAEWAGAPNYAGSNDVTYASNDGSSTVFGLSGSLVPNQAIGTAVTRDIVFPHPIDQFEVKYSSAGLGFFNVGGQFPFITQGASLYGLSYFKLNSTTVRVTFQAQGQRPTNATYAGNGDPWSTRFTAGDRFLVIGYRPGAAVGFGAATQDRLGLVKAGQVPGTNTNDNAVAGYVGEYGETTGSTVTSITSGTATNGHSVSLAPGDYDVWGYGNFEPTGTDATSAKRYDLCISTATGTVQNPLQSTYMLGNNITNITTGLRRISLSTTTTIYLVTRITNLAGTAGTNRILTPTIYWRRTR